MTEFSSFDAPTGQAPAHPQAQPAIPVPSLPSLPPQATRPPGQPAVPAPGPHASGSTTQPAAPPPAWKKPKRPLPIRLLIWAVVIVALVATASFAKRYWDTSRQTASVPASDRSAPDVDSAAQLPPVADESTDANSTVCSELQDVQELSNEISLIMSTTVQEISAAPGETDETALLTRFREAADLMELSLPDLLATYEAAAQDAPADVAADLRVVANGTALLTPALVDVLRSAQALDDIAKFEQALASPELADAAIEAGTASLRLDEFTIPACGFTFSS